MKATRPTDIVLAWLRTHGYFRTIEAPVEDDNSKFDFIVADGKLRRMIVAVNRRTAKLENEKTLLRLAHKYKRETWLATVVAEDRIEWKELK
jgi:hypothetical protein